MSASVEEVARRVARLLDHPRRRLSVPKRFVWPFRVLGFLAAALPAAGRPAGRRHAAARPNASLAGESRCRFRPRRHAGTDIGPPTATTSIVTYFFLFARETA